MKQFDHKRKLFGFADCSVKTEPMDEVTRIGTSTSDPLRVPNAEEIVSSMEIEAKP